MNRRSGEPVIVYQMGKVGSSTIARSLEAIRWDRPVFQIHMLERGRLDQKPVDAPLPSGPVWESKNVIRLMERRHPGVPWTIVARVREPVARNVSAFFQALSWYYPRFHEEAKTGEYNVEAMAAAFLDQYLHDTPLN